jgi:FKBP-type peptidyl-prolyl cis-trans isomerase 2
VTVDFTGKTDGVEFPGGQARDFAIVLGEGRMLPEFETALAGMKDGETKTFELTFPEDYHGKEMAGKKAEFELHVKQVEKGFAPPWTRSSRAPSASRAAASTSFGARSRRTCVSSSSARSRRK